MGARVKAVIRNARELQKYYDTNGSFPKEDLTTDESAKYARLSFWLKSMHNKAVNGKVNEEYLKKIREEAPDVYKCIKAERKRKVTDWADTSGVNIYRRAEEIRDFIADNLRLPTIHDGEKDKALRDRVQCCRSRFFRGALGYDTMRILGAINPLILLSPRNKLDSSIADWALALDLEGKSIRDIEIPVKEKQDFNLKLDDAFGGMAETNKKRLEEIGVTNFVGLFCAFKVLDTHGISVRDVISLDIDNLVTRFDNGIINRILAIKVVDMEFKSRDIVGQWRFILKLISYFPVINPKIALKNGNHLYILSDVIRNDDWVTFTEKAVHELI